MSTSWDLSVFQIALDQESIQNACDQLDIRLQDFVDKNKGRIASFDAKEWKEYFSQGEALSKEMYRIAQSIGLAAAQDLTNSSVMQLQSLVDTRLSAMNKIIIPLSLEIRSLGSEFLLRLASNSDLSAYTNYFTQLAYSVKHVLSESEEKLIITKSVSLSSNYIQLYDTLSGGHMFKHEGGEYTEGVIRSWRSDIDKNKRKIAFDLLKDYYSSTDQLIVRGGIYYGIVTDWVNDAKLRKYSSSISVQNLSEEMQDSDVEKLLTGVGDRYGVYHKFLHLKAQKLGSEKLNYTDLFAPLTSTKEVIPWEQGWKLTHRTLSQIDPKIGEYMTQLLESGCIDVFPKKGKQGGAFASYNKYFGQYVKLNYVDDIDSVTTLAHELGHAYHGHLSLHQPQEVYSTPLVLAETASTFFQLALMDTLLQEKPELAESIVIELLEDFFATVVRQVQYVRFEKRIHQTIWDGGVFDYNTCSTIWEEEAKLMLGDGVVGVDEYAKYGWSGIPHIFHTPFYCYSYAFGLLFALALYEDYTNTKSPTKLFSILELGGSKTPSEMLAIAGIDSIDSMIAMGYNKVDEWMEKLK